jgi:hypothetical protein
MDRNPIRPVSFAPGHPAAVALVVPGWATTDGVCDE